MYEYVFKTVSPVCEEMCNQCTKKTHMHSNTHSSSSVCTTKVLRLTCRPLSIVDSPCPFNVVCSLISSAIKYAPLSCTIRVKFLIENVSIHEQHKG